MPRKGFLVLGEVQFKIAKKCLSFLFEGLCVLLILSVLQPIETRVFINQQPMHFVGTQKKVIQSTSATEGITSYEPKQERAHNHFL
jgi:hypothetical protein